MGIAVSKRARIAGVGFLVVLVGAGATFVFMTLSSINSPARQPGVAAASLIRNEALDDLPKVDRSKAYTERLAKGLAPPTNTWFSGLALQETPEPVFPYPNSFLATNSGFSFGLPSVTATAETIAGPHRDDVAVRIAEAIDFRIARYDELTVTLEYFSRSNDTVAEVTIASGSPYIFVKTPQGASLDYGAPSTAETQEFSRGDQTYGVRRSGDVMSFFGIPQSADAATLNRLALNVVSGGSISYAARGNEMKTTLTYATDNNQPTLIAQLPHQQSGAQPVSLTYESILGPLTVSEAKTFSFRVPTAIVTASLPVSSLSKNDQDQLREQVQRDAQSLPAERTDTYFGAKQLQRTAQLLLLADELSLDEETRLLQRDLSRRLTDWLGPDGMFEYDTRAQTIVGRDTSFGADTEINDHHFHYGYIIYAASVLAQFDDQFLDEYGKNVDLLVADIANYRDDEPLPQRRNFDAYAGHSWASGTSPFKDGNNQESTSEAMNAWTGVVLWARRTTNKTLEDQATWMLSNETATAKKYWLTPPDDPGYTAPLSSIVWGGKREYKTFFSDEANAKLGILLLPLNPSMRDYAASLPRSIYQGTSNTGPFGDYLLMARGDATLEQAKMLPDSSIDDGNSRSYMYAYILAKSN